MKFRSGSEEKVYNFLKDNKVKVKYEPDKYSYECMKLKLIALTFYYLMVLT